MLLFNHKKKDVLSIGALHEEAHYDITDWLMQNDLGNNMKELVEKVSRSSDGIRHFTSLLEKAIHENDGRIKKIDLPIRFAAVMDEPEKILCIGLNYRSHSEECKMDIPEYPVVFSKFNNALAAHEDEIIVPADIKKLDYEVELVLIIGKEAKDISIDDAMSHIAGFTIGNDISARDLQFRTAQWLIGKSCDGFAPVGPYLALNDGLKTDDMEIICKVNGEVRQKAKISDMIFPIPELVSYLSKHMTLKPGDLVFTGTPSGVILGMPTEEQVWLKDGDVMEMVIDGLGTLRNIIVTSK